MPNLPQVAPAQIITAQGWNNLVNDLNPFTQALKIVNNAGSPTPAPATGGNLFINGVNNWQNTGDEAILFLGHSEYFIKAKRDQGLTIGAKWATTGIVISDGGDTRIGGANPARAKLEVDGGDPWVTNEWSKSLLLTAANPSLTFNYPAAATKFGIGMKNTGGIDKLHIFSTDADLNLNTGAFSSRLVIQEDGNVGIGVSNPGMKLEVGGAMKVNGFLTIEGSDLRLGTNDGRAQGTKTTNRALVHYDQDTLVMNFDGDFEGGVRVVGPKLVVDGNVGIGTSNPQAKLEIQGGPKWTDNGWNKSIRISNGDAIQFDAGTNKFGIGASHSGDSLYFFTTLTESNSGPLNYRLRITSAGDIFVTDGNSPIIFRRFPIPANTDEYDTGFSESEYNAGVVGIGAGYQAYMTIKNAKWYIKNGGVPASRNIDVIFCRKEISSRSGY